MNFFIKLIFSSLILISCGDSDNIDEITNSDDITNENNDNEIITESFDDAITLVSSTLIKALSIDDVANRTNSFINARPNYEVDAYKIVYITKDVDGSEIEASGIILLPEIEVETPIISYQHGTLTDKSAAPSLFNQSSISSREGTIMASNGYTVIMPDYIGYGVSSNLLHPYEHAESLATSSFDMVVAAKEFMEEKDLQISDKLFLTGYSEGGGATMALHKYIEENSDWEVTMSAPASGAYNKTAFSLNVIKRNENLSFLPFYVWVFDSYNRIYQINSPWDEIVVSDQAIILNQIIDPTLYPSAPINGNPAQFFNESFITDFSNGNDTEFTAAFAENDCFDWVHKYPITLFYGTADDFVIPLNSTTAFDAITTNGGDISTIVYEGGNHSTSFPLYINDVFTLFESLK